MKSELPVTNHGHLPSGTLIYMKARCGVSSLWTQPVDGGAPKQSTGFKSDLIFQFDFFPRRQRNRDCAWRGEERFVLISNSK
jgi:hypothetical protein